MFIHSTWLFSELYSGSVVRRPFELLIQIGKRVKMKASVENNPGDQEAGGRGHETLLHQLPNAAERFLVDLLEVNAVNIHDSAVDGTESTTINA